MPKGLVEILGLKITRPYKDLYSFDSKRLKCLGLIKDMVVSLNKLPSEIVVMDVGVVDIPPKFGIFIVKVLDLKVKGKFANGYVLCYNSCSK